MKELGPGGLYNSPELRGLGAHAGCDIDLLVSAVSTGIGSSDDADEEDEDDYQYGYGYG